MKKKRKKNLNKMVKYFQKQFHNEKKKTKEKKRKQQTE